MRGWCHTVLNSRGHLVCSFLYVLKKRLKKPKFQMISGMFQVIYHSRHFHNKKKKSTHNLTNETKYNSVH